MMERVTARPEGSEARAALTAQLAHAAAELKAHMASMEYAYAMGSTRDGAREHPLHWATRARTDQLVARVEALRARLAEYE